MDGVAQRLAGDPSHPFAARSAPGEPLPPERVYHPDRVLHPLKRVGPKEAHSSRTGELGRSTRRHRGPMAGHHRGVWRGGHPAVHPPAMQGLIQLTHWTVACLDRWAAAISIATSAAPSRRRTPLDHDRHRCGHPGRSPVHRPLGHQHHRHRLHYWPLVREARRRGDACGDRSCADAHRRRGRLVSAGAARAMPSWRSRCT